MVIQHKQTGSRGMFFVAKEQEILAELVYTIPSKEQIIIEHTEVEEELKGQNIGLQLVEAAVKYARQANIRIIPTCSFAKAMFQRKPEYNDVLA